MIHAHHATRFVALRGVRQITPSTKWYKRRSLLTLAIETSCDDTCVAILEKQSKFDTITNQQNETIASSSSAAAATVDRIPNAPHARLHFNRKITIPNTGWGGIHPLEALDSHRTNLAKLIAEALPHLPDAHDGTQAKTRVLVMEDGSVKRKPDFITVTRGPGMRNNLSCGLDTAKGLAIAWRVPLVGAHHMQAHALTPRLAHATEWVDDVDNDGNPRLRPAFPFLTLLVSGGHTMLVHSTGLTQHRILATTSDTAIGDALDKCGRLILPHDVRASARDTAFGKYLSEFAFSSSLEFKHYDIPRTRAAEIGKGVNDFGWQIQTPLSDTRKLAFSFAGITSQADALFARRASQLGGEPGLEERKEFARTVMGTAFEHLGSRTLIALEKLRQQRIEIPALVVSGGVAANDFLRYFLRTMLDLRGFPNVQLIFPPVSLCTDNAAMIAWCGMEMFEAGYHSDFGIKSLKKWSMDSSCEDGGILGVGGWIKIDT